MRNALASIIIVWMLTLVLAVDGWAGPRAVLSWRPDSVVENLEQMPADTTFLYVELIDIEDMRSLSFETVWSPWSWGAACYELVSTSAHAECGWHEGSGVEELSEGIRTSWTIHFDQNPPSARCIRLAFVFGSCTSDLSGSFCLRNAMMTDSSGNEIYLETPNVATILGGVQLQRPQYVVGVDQGTLTTGIPTNLIVRGGHFSEPLEVWLNQASTGRDIHLETEVLGSAEVRARVTPTEAEAGYWSLVTKNGDGYEAALSYSIEIRPAPDTPADSTAFVNGRNFRRTGGVWYEVVGENVGPISHDIVVVKFRDDVRKEEIAKLNAALHATEISKDIMGFWDLRLEPGVDPVCTTASYLRDPRVECAETVPIIHYESNDTYYPEQFWLSNAEDEDTDAAVAWTYETGVDTVIIAVLDTGVDFLHEDLSGNMWVNPDDPWDELDNDDNGKVDDTYGWDFSYVSWPSARWCLRGNHGTVVAGAAAATTNNAKGVAGVAGGYGGWCSEDHLNSGVSLMALGIGVEGTPDEPTAAYARNAIYYAVDHGARVINMSWSILQGREYLDSAIEHAYHEGDCLLVAAAGNESQPGPRYPASHGYVVAVGAIDDQGRLWRYSNRGPEVVAPVGGKDCAGIPPPTSCPDKKIVCTCGQRMRITFLFPTILIPALDMCQVHTPISKGRSRPLNLLL